MGLFSSRRAKADAKAQGETAESAAGAAESATKTAAGPFDVADQPEGEHIDFGSLRIPPREGMDIAVEVEQATRRMSGLNLSYAGSAIQLNAFAAPKTEGIWQDVRAGLRESISQQGGTTESREGEFGTELYARIPVRTKGTAPTHRPMRFVGVDGPRWMLRAVISGAALVDAAKAKEVNEIIRSVVVVRGTGPMAPREVLEVSIPRSESAANESGPTLDSLDPGPTIAEVR